jgi:hypothetical protein
MHPRRASLLATVVPLALLSFVSEGAAQETGGTGALARDVEGALVKAAERGALPDTPLRVSAPASARHELGAVVDPRADGGPRVLALTPGGAAERMGLRAGDILRTVNGVDLASAGRPGEALAQAVAADNGSLRVGAVRDGRALSLAGSADVVAVPAYTLVVGDSGRTGCGHVSDTAGPPPRSRDIYRAQILRIDGRSTPLDPVPRHRVDAGRHVLLVRELIDRSWLGSAQASQIARMQKFEDAGAYKALVVDIAPNRSYRIGARLREDRLDGESIRANAYWEPVVWSEIAEACR